LWTFRHPFNGHDDSGERRERSRSGEPLQRSVVQMEDGVQPILLITEAVFG
jgi:hypothetical protein